MLIHRKSIYIVSIAGILAAKPVLKKAVDRFYRFTVVASTEAGSSIARVIGEYDGNARIIGRCPNGGFSKPGMAYHSNVFLINGSILHQIIHSPKQTEGPCTNRFEFRLIE